MEPSGTWWEGWQCSAGCGAVQAALLTFTDQAMFQSAISGRIRSRDLLFSPGWQHPETAGEQSTY